MANQGGSGYDVGKSAGAAGAKPYTEWRQLAQVRIVPRLDGYMVEVVYEQQEEQAEVDKGLVAALDPGVNVLAALTSNKPGFVPRLVSGKPLEKPQPILQ